MTLVFSPILAELSVSRVIAGLALPPLLACAFQPFPDLYLSYLQRIVFWAGVMGLALGVTWVSRHVTQNYFSDVHFSWRDAVLVPVVLALFVPSMWLLSCLLLGYGGHPTPGLMSVAPYGALFATGLILLRGHDQSKRTLAVSAPVLPRLSKRLPRSFAGQIYHLTVRDHFVDVVTSEGVFTIRSRFVDAIAEMEPVPGHCTHRSHWVTDDAIAGVEKTDGKTFLRLKNDELVPVSRKYKPMLEQDGII